MALFFVLLIRNLIKSKRSIPLFKGNDNTPSRTLIFLGFSCKLYIEGFLDGYALIYEGVNGYQNLSE